MMEGVTASIVKILSSYSIKGGVGKTALSINLAFAFQQCGKRTLLVDLDPQGAAGFYYRVSPSEEFNAKEEDLSKEQVKSNIRESDYPGLDILPSNLAYRKFDLLLDRMKKRRSQLRRLLEPFEEDYDRIMLDSPPNITLLSENLFSCFRPDLGAGDSNDALGAHPRATFPVLHGEGATPGGYSPVFLDGPEA
jgi:chromosome partitioning protein